MASKFCIEASKFFSSQKRVNLRVVEASQILHRKSELNSAERKLGFDPRNLIWIIPAKGVMNDAN